MTDACLTKDELLAFAAGRATRDTERIDAHVDGCATCRELLEQAMGAVATAPGTHDPDAAGASGTGFLRAGATVGRYVIREPLGAGGMGVVHLAHDPTLRRDVALKVLRPDAGGAGDLLQRQARLLREARAMARLRHPNVVAVFDVGAHGAGLFIAMELIEGRTMREWLKAERPSWREVLRVLRAAGEGLVAAHATGVIHRDFKPDNVLLGDDGRVCVSDFGIAATSLETLGGTGPGAPLTTAGVILGTPGYMAPEQVLGEPSDARTDVFSFCVTFYEALYGQRPFVPSGESQVVVPSVVRPPPKSAGVPGWLRRVVLAGLAIAPADRPGSMRALLDQLDEARHRRRVIALGVAASLVAGAAIGGVAWGVAARSPSGATTTKATTPVIAPPAPAAVITQPVIAPPAPAVPAAVDAGVAPVAVPKPPASPLPPRRKTKAGRGDKPSDAVLKNFDL